MHWQPRHSVLSILFGAYLICYLDRMAIASALPFIAQELDLAPLAMGSVLSAFFVGYALMQIPGGMLADKFGPKRVIVGALVGWSMFTFLTGTAGSWLALLALRVLFGVSEGPFPPAASKTIAMWFPRREIGRANGLQLASINIGAVIAPILVAPLIVTWGWRSVFYVLLVPGLILTLIITRCVPDGQRDIDSSTAAVASNTAPIRMTDVLRMPAVCWCCVTLFFSNIAGWGLMNWLPTYLLQARGFSISHMGLSAPLPYLAGAVGYYAGGHISDRYFAQRREIPIALGMLLAATMTYVAAVVPSSAWAVAALAGAFLFSFTASGGLFTLPLVVAPREAVGVVFGIVNSVAQTAAFLSPLLVGYVLDVSQGNFRLVFYLLVLLLIVGVLAAVRIRTR